MSTLALLFASALAAPAMVTTTQGEIQLVGQGSTTPAPAPPFLLDEGVELKLAAGAQAVVLFDGTARRLTGPATITRTSLGGGKAHSGAGRNTSMLDELLSVQHSQASAGAHRAGVALVRPLPGGDVLELGEIRWACDGCGPQKVEVVDFLEGETLWTATGTGSVTYAGPPLAADSVQIAVGSERFTVYRAGEGKRATLEKAKAAAAEPMAALRASGDRAGEASVLLGLYAHIGLESDALRLADELVAKHPGDAGFAAIRAGLERRALPAP